MKESSVHKQVSEGQNSNTCKLVRSEPNELTKLLFSFSDLILFDFLLSFILKSLNYILLYLQLMFNFLSTFYKLVYWVKLILCVNNFYFSFWFGQRQNQNFRLVVNTSGETRNSPNFLGVLKISIFVLWKKFGVWDRVGIKINWNIVNFNFLWLNDDFLFLLGTFTGLLSTWKPTWFLLVFILLLHLRFWLFFLFLL